MWDTSEDVHCCSFGFGFLSIRDGELVEENYRKTSVNY